ncbi:MAG: hypothetical protein QOI65_774 [Thermoleophilaceae bacterium]|nr:hypothetical protein [Thermoleophilaceae bacterium]
MPLAVLALLAVLVTRGDDGHSGARGGAAGEGNPVAGFIDDLASPWLNPGVQRPPGAHFAGNYREPVSGGTRYGDSLLGYTMILTGLRTHHFDRIRSGLRALAFSVPRATLHTRPSIFEIIGIAGAYNLARHHLAREPLFTRQKAQWEEYLKHVKLIRLPATTYFGNHWLVEAVEVRELLRTGIHSDDPNAVLGGDRAAAERLSRDLINRRIPAMARTNAVGTPIGRAFVLSDPPDNPLAYQGLSFGFYARAIQMLGDRASPAARRTLVDIARASLLVTAPDGDLAYFGRNQEECWALAGTALGAFETASFDESTPALDAQLRELAQRSIRRLQTVYRIGDHGLYYAPIVRRDPANALKALDPGAGGPSFAGVVQLMMEWSRPIAEAAPRGATIPADHPLRAKLSHGESRFDIVRRGRFWYAVRPTTSGKHPDDIRSDFGLIAFKARQRSGAWRDVVHMRPFTRGGGPRSAGPVLRTGGLLGLPFASRVRIAGDGTVAMRMAWRGPPTPIKYTVATLPSGVRIRALGYTPGPTYRDNVRIDYAPAPCGVRMSVDARAGDTIEYSVFLTRANARTSPTAVSDELSRTTFNRPAQVSLENGYNSSVESNLVRARLTFANLPAGPLEITTCAPA